MDTNRRVRVGQRVWVTYDEGRAFGQVAAIPTPFSSDSTGFVVLLDQEANPCDLHTRTARQPVGLRGRPPH